MKPIIQTQPSTPLRLTTVAGIDKRDSQVKKLSRKQLINILNRIHFADGEIHLRFKHNKLNSIITLHVSPDACDGEYLKGSWSETTFPPDRIKSYRFNNATFTDGFKHILVPAELIELDQAGVVLKLPEYSYETAQREIKRFSCTGISAQISQDGWVVNGELVNFTAQALVVEFHHEYSLLRTEIDPGHNLHLILKRDEEFIFSGQCTLLRQESSHHLKKLVLRPLTESISRVKAKEIRSERVTLTPLPTISFEHPLVRKNIHLGLSDISGLGFSVEESFDNSLLLTGMIIPNLHIQFMHGFSVQCKAQVLYRKVNDYKVKCGLVILDMNMNDYLKLSSLIHQAINRNSYINTSNIDLDALWDFFFETGFVYPEKYLHIADQKEKFISVYKKLYNESPEIARHVIYQDCGKIYGHVSMFRYYQSTWLMHHHAAIKSTKHKAGLVVMDHILQYINELHTLPSAKMNYIGCYFRPNNRFSSRVFGASSKALDDPKKSSLDEFAYLYFQPTVTENQKGSWTLCESEHEDINIFSHWYEFISGGLLQKALDLHPETLAMDGTISEEYSAAGFRRDRKIFSLKKENDLLALIVINVSDFGLNMSDLTNCIQVFAMDEKILRKELLTEAISRLTKYYENKSIPVLLYPKSYADYQGFSYKKTYTLGILDLRYMSEYLQFIKSLTDNKKSIEIREVQ